MGWSATINGLIKTAWRRLTHKILIYFTHLFIRNIYWWKSLHDRNVANPNVIQKWYQNTSFKCSNKCYYRTRRRRNYQVEHSWQHCEKHNTRTSVKETKENVYSGVVHKLTNTHVIAGYQSSARNTSYIIKIFTDLTSILSRTRLQTRLPCVIITTSLCYLFKWSSLLWILNT